MKPHNADEVMTPEPDVKRVCLDCEFATADEAKADAHFAWTGHMLAIDWQPAKVDWPTLPPDPELA